MTVKQLPYFSNGEFKHIEDDQVHGLLRSLHRRGDRPGPPVHAGRGGGGRRRGRSGVPRLGGHPAEQARPGPLPDEGPPGQAPGRADRARGHGARQGAGRGHGRRAQGDRAGRVRLRHPPPHEGPGAHERHRRLRHHAVHGAAGRLRRHRPLELPRHAPHGLGGAALHRHGQHPGAEAGQLRAPVRHPHHGAVGGGRAAQGRHQPRHLLAQRGGDPPEAPRHQGRLLRRLHLGRQAHLRHRGGQRQARAGAHRGEEPRPGAEGRGPGAHGARHRELGLRLRGRALHGAARGRRGRGDRRQAGRPAGRR